jgi:hypothetical protein
MKNGDSVIFASGCENFSITFPSFFLFFSSHRAPHGSTPQWAWGAHLAGKHASPASALGLVVGGGGGMEKVAIFGRQWLWRNIDG